MSILFHSPYSFDRKCWKLADYFLEDYSVSEEQIDNLAQEIQTAIGDWFKAQGLNKEPDGNPDNE
jgi:hypothetical protein